MASLQDQLLKAGLADKASAKQARADKRKKQKQKNKQKQPVVDEATIAAQQAAEEKKARSRELNQLQQQEREKRSIIAQVRQLITVNKQPRNGETLLNFTHDNVVKRLYVSEEMHKQVTKGRLAVVLLDDAYELVPAPVADKIAQRDEASVIYRADLDKSGADGKDEEEDDWYADYEIPDDLICLDIGPGTINQFSEVVQDSGTILWNGPMGVFEVDGFHHGTQKIAEKIAAVTERGMMTIIGGGDSAAAIKKFGLMKKVSHVSTGGGASLELLSGNTLPAIYSLEI